MEAIVKGMFRNGPVVAAVAVLVVLGIGFATILGLSPEQQEALLWIFQDYLPILMFVTLAVLLFSGFPVAFILGGLALLYGLALLTNYIFVINLQQQDIMAYLIGVFLLIGLCVCVC